jgi:hypothetical protein
MNSTIILRAHTDTRGQRKKKVRQNCKLAANWPPYALVFDCETRTDERQSLTFGFFRLLQNVGDSYVGVREEGIFYDPEEITRSELHTLKQYCEKAETARDVVPHNVLLLNKQEFIETFFFPHAETGSLIVGFNLPFDLSRLASDARPATRVNEDWSLVFRNESANPDKLRKREFRIKVDRKDGKIAFFSLSGFFVHRGRFSSKGRFLDLFALAWSLTSTSYKLKSLTRELRKRGYKVPQKLDHKPTGHVTRREIAYCRQDVRVTSGILNALRSEFDHHPDIALILNPDNALSPASIFKAYLQAMGIILPSQKFRFPPKIQGIAAQAYYGGRSEVRIRLAQVPVAHTDFVSEYPTVIMLTGLWPFLIATRLRVRTATQEVKSLLTKVLGRPDLVFDPVFWKKFTGYALIEPDHDILPIRTEYNENSDENNIGVNIFKRADHPIWFAIPDLIASALLSHTAPKILKAILIVPEGIQKGLRSIKLRGKEEVDPISGNLFQSLIEAKER